MTDRRTASIRTHIILIVMAGSILPLALVGTWLASSALRAGRNLLRQHLTIAADRFVTASNARWQYRVSDLELLARNAVTSRALSGTPLTLADSQYLKALVTDMSGWISAAQILDGSDHVWWSSSVPASVPGRSPGALSFERQLELRVSTGADATGRDGTVVVDARLASLIPADSGRPLVAGSRIALRQRSTGALFAVLDAAVTFPTTDAIQVNGKPWLVERRVIEGPGLEFAVGAPLESYVSPLESAGRVGLISLAAVTAFAFLLTTYLATRLTKPLDRLVHAADAVANGNLEHHVADVGPTELRRLGSSFNTMTDSLQRTLAALAEQRALAVVGEFAASLSHDVRNALTSIKVDLQRATRRPTDDVAGRELVNRALNNVARLESSVTGALRVARTGQVVQETLDLRDVLTAAAGMVLGAYSAIPSSLDLDLGDSPHYMTGDRAALEQLFANLLFNAGQAERAGGRVRLSLEALDGKLVATVTDDGVGMNAAELDNVSRARHSSRQSGNGLGLPIARQIAAAHGGDIRIASVPGEGTSVRVELSTGDWRAS